LLFNIESNETSERYINNHKSTSTILIKTIWRESSRKQKNAPQKIDLSRKTIEKNMEKLQNSSRVNRIKII